MDIWVIVMILAAICSILLSTALIMAVFTIRNNAIQQTQLLAEQRTMLKSIQVSNYLLLKKDVSKIQVRNKEEIKVVDLSTSLKNSNLEVNYTIESVI